MIRRFFSVAQNLFAQPRFPGLLASTFTLGVAFAFVAPFLSKWGTEEVGMSPMAFGLFMTVTSISAMIVSTALARLSDTTFSRKHMLALGGAGGTLGFVGYAVVREPLVLLVIGCSLHAVASISFAQLFSHVREEYRQSERNTSGSSFTMSVVRVCFSFAWTVGPAVGSLALISFGFRGLFLAAAGLYLLFLLGVLRFVPHRKRSRASNSAFISAPVWKTLRRPDLLLCFLAFAAIFAANSINMLNLPLALTRTFGGSESDLGIVFGIGPLVEIPLMLWFGHLAAKGYQLTLIQIGVVVTLLYFVGLSFASAVWHVYLLQILSGVSFAILTNVAIVFFQDLVPGQMGLATSLFSNAQALGNLVGMLSFGFVVELLGHQNAFRICAALAGVAVMLIGLYRGRGAGYAR